MRLLRLEGEGLGGRAIDLHPEISVLTDLDDDLRDRLLRACQALPAGEDPGCEGLIEAHGVLFDLGTDALVLLGLDRPLDVVMGPDDKPLDPPTEGPSTVEVLEAAIIELRAIRAELDRGQLAVLTELETARESLDPFARTAREQAQGRADRAAGLPEVEQMVDDLEDEEPLKERLAEIERIERELEEVDRDAIAEALAIAVEADHPDPEAVEAGRLGVELRQIDTELADLDSALEAQGLDPVELARGRDALSMEVARLESEHAPSDIDPDDRAELEEAHDDVVAAQAKVSGSLLGGRSAERRLEEAVEAEAIILERIGQPTYSAFVMAVTVGSVDAELENRLHEARQELAAGQAEYESATELLEHDPARSTLTLRREEIVARGTELLGRDPGPDVVGQLLTFKRRRDEARPIDDLRHLMEREGLLVPGIGLEDPEVCDFAAAWIAETTDAVEHDRQVEAEGLQESLAEIERARAEADARRAEAADVAPSDELVEAGERLERHEQATARVAELTELLQDVDRRRHEIEARLEAQEAVAEVARLGAAADAAVPEQGASLVELRDLLRARIADHRDRSFAGAVPMVIGGVFAGLGRDTVGDLLNELAEEADGVQLIILDDDLPVVTWATSVEFERAAVVAPE